MTYLSSLVAGPSSASPGLTTVQGSGAMKSSILVFDSRPGTRTYTPSVTGKYRVAVAGAGAVDGGGYSEDYFTLIAGTAYSYTVGAAGSPSTTGGTSSFNAAISATGGGSGGAPGVGSGGKINTAGGVGSANGGGASGHRYGNGGDSIVTGGGWSQAGSTNNGGAGGVDGFGLGLTPGQGGTNCNTTNFGGTNGGYGAGGGVGTNAGIGGGGGTNSGGGLSIAGIGGGTASTNPSRAGNGVVIVELIG